MLNPKPKIELFLLVALVLFLPKAQADVFYDASLEVNGLVVNLATDYGATGLGTEDDSAKLQAAIDFASSQGGGVVVIPAGLYQWAEVDLKSNVHIEVDQDVVITPVLDPNSTNSVSVFSLGDDQVNIANVSIRGIGGRFSIMLPTYEPGVRAFSFSNVTNFFISDVDIFDSLTKFSCFAMGPGLKNMTDIGIPTQGTIANASSFNAAYGYGLVQVQSANTVNFRNLYSLGGATLRVETGWTRMNDWQIPGTGAFNIVGTDIACEDGNAAVMLSPHSMHNGVVRIDGVTSQGCGFAVRLGGGFISSKQTNPNLTDGTFAQGTCVRNVTGTFGTNAQLKSKHFQYMPNELLDQIQDIADSEDGASVRGPAIAAMLYTPNYPVEISNISDSGFLYNPEIVSDGPVPSPTLLGDTNLDGVVNFLDISPFIAVLSAGGFQAEADCHHDGEVNFLDIAPFIALLVG